MHHHPQVVRPLGQRFRDRCGLLPVGWDRRLDRIPVLDLWLALRRALKRPEVGVELEVLSRRRVSRNRDVEWRHGQSPTGALFSMRMVATRSPVSAGLTHSFRNNLSCPVGTYCTLGHRNSCSTLIEANGFGMA